MYGKKFSDDAKKKQKETLFRNHGVTNAYFLSKHRSISKSQLEIYQHLSTTFPAASFECDKFFANQTHYFIDVISELLKLAIEFNGDYWHCNPASYDPEFLHPKKKMTARQIWEYDNRKEEILRAAGYSVIVIWESDYRHDKHAVFKKLDNAVGALSG